MSVLYYLFFTLILKNKFRRKISQLEQIKFISSILILNKDNMIKIEFYRIFKFFSEKSWKTKYLKNFQPQKNIFILKNSLSHF